MLLDVDTHFHLIPAVASAADKVVWPRLLQLEHIPTASRNVGYEVAIVARLVVAPVHLQHTVVVLIEHKICRQIKNPATK